MPPTDQYALVFADEFDALSVSDGRTATANWYTSQAWGGGFGSAKFMPAGSAASPFSIVRQGDANALQIELTRDQNGMLQSGLISNTFPDGTSKTPQDGDAYGYYETRMWLPDGQGVWPAFWAIEKERLTADRDHVIEIDVMEQHGADLGDRYASHVHDWDWKDEKLEGHSSQYQHNVTGANVLTSGWHTYGVEVLPDKMTFYMDGVAHFSIDTPAGLNTDLMFMFDLAAGGGWTIDPGLDHQEMYIDYFRVYELAENAPFPDDPTVKYGTSGDDTHYVTAKDVRIVEDAGGGCDTVCSTVSRALEDNVENLVLTGAANLDGVGNALNNELHGNTGANRLSGRDGADSLYGGDGNDTLDGGARADLLEGGAGADRLVGGAGADRLVGGAGNDLYVVDHAKDRVVETANAGFDTVRTSVRFTLPANCEALVLTGKGAIDATGNSGKNILMGNAGANVLDGLRGSDILTGGGGADSFSFATALGPKNIDRIEDFGHGADRIVLENAVFKGLSAGVLNDKVFAVKGDGLQANDRVIYDRESGALFFDRDGSGSHEAIKFATVTAGTHLDHSDFLVI